MFFSTSFGGAKVITPHDTNLQPFKALYVGGTGNITLTTTAGDDILFSAIPVGTILPIQGTRVKSTGTTATLIVALT